MISGIGFVALSTFILLNERIQFGRQGRKKSAWRLLMAAVREGQFGHNFKGLVRTQSEMGRST
jgi:hypothetical protein